MHSDAKSATRSSLCFLSPVICGVGGLPPVVSEVLRSPGEPLDPATCTLFGSRFAHDFGHVSVDAGRRSDALEREADQVAARVADQLAAAAAHQQIPIE